MPMFVGLAFVGCSNGEDFNPGNDNETNEDPKYLTVSINTTGTMTRATTSDGEYEAGTGEENKVTSVRFYFLDENNAVINVKKSTGENWVNYYDVDSPNSKGDDMNNVEKILKATLVIQSQKGDKLPSSIMAVLNPTAELKKEGSMGLAALNNFIKDFSTTTTNFLMSNSVYAKDGTKMEAVSVDNHLYTTADAAEADPVIIHVERVLAKTRLTVGLTAVTLENGVKIYKTTKSGTKETETFKGEDIYVKFLGWNVTATTNKSRLLKEINPAWKSDLFSNSILWNTADYCRSFWAVNPTGIEYKYGNFTNHAQDIKDFDAGTDENPKVNYTYLQENASDDSKNGTDPTTPSQVIIAAQLVNEKGVAMEFAEYAGIRYTIDGLLNKYAELADLWTVNAAGDGRRQITPNDIELFTDADEHDNETQKETENRYKVYVKLKDEATIWYASEDKTDNTPVKANERLKSMGSAKVWKGGNTYYYFEIHHQNGEATAANAKGKYGVVRNHVYAANIHSLVGLGTPVYDPEEVIYPEKPGGDDTYIAAEIRILSWRIVNQNIDLEW